MLHLRRYLTLIVRSSRLYSSRCKSAKSRPSRCEGYVFGYVHPRHTSLRPEVYVATCNRTCVTTVLQSSQSDVVDHKLMSFCDDVKKGRISADGLREVIDLCSKNDYQLPHDTGVLLLKCCGNLLPDLEAAERDNLANQVEYNLFRGKTMGMQHYDIQYYVDKKRNVRAGEVRLVA